MKYSKDYENMEIDFYSLALPNNKKDKKRLIKRFKKEFGEKFLLDPRIDPYNAWNCDYVQMFCNDVIYERIKLVRILEARYKDALLNKRWNEFVELLELTYKEGWNCYEKWFGDQ
jgi:hypothetical protein